MSRLPRVLLSTALCVLLCACASQQGKTEKFDVSPGTIILLQNAALTPVRTIQFPADKGLQVQLAHFESKDHPDVVFLRDNNGVRDILVARSSTRWEQGMTATLPEKPVSVQVFDWDGDGTPEIVYAVPGTARVAIAPVRVGQPDVSSTQIQFSNEDFSMATARAGFHDAINADGAEEYGFWYPEKSVLVTLLSTGSHDADGDAHILKLSNDAAIDVNDMVVTDINHDGKKALVAALGPGAQRKVSVFSFSGTSINVESAFGLKLQTESPTTKVEVESPDSGTTSTVYLDLGVLRVAVGDLDGDGLPDLVTANGMAGTISVALNKGHHQFVIRSYRINYPGAKRIPTISAVGLADADSDGRLDAHILATIQKAADDTYTDAIIIAKGDGKGGFSGLGYLELPSPASDMVVADIDGNGAPDYALLGSPLRIIFR